MKSIKKYSFKAEVKLTINRLVDEFDLHLDKNMTDSDKKLLCDHLSQKVREQLQELPASKELPKSSNNKSR